ncbi:hypothetical protein FLONG3_631 [Fusarium longipes]|uniref:Copper-fist domain-containing protein n=1 Tax=Fusarium longipes TaxID=694270 RepID=A0A395T9Z0_9HYPO|nr:hypothetical protein FLONG3_631 [Fusarium longipes]
MSNPNRSRESSSSLENWTGRVKDGKRVCCEKCMDDHRKRSNCQESHGGILIVLENTAGRPVGATRGTYLVPALFLEDGTLLEKCRMTLPGVKRPTPQFLRCKRVNEYKEQMRIQQETPEEGPAWFASTPVPAPVPAPTAADFDPVLYPGPVRDFAAADFDMPSYLSHGLDLARHFGLDLKFDPAWASDPDLFLPPGFTLLPAPVPAFTHVFSNPPVPAPAVNMVFGSNTPQVYGMATGNMGQDFDLNQIGFGFMPNR